MMHRCQACGWEFEATTPFCAHCGSRIEYAAAAVGSDEATLAATALNAPAPSPAVRRRPVSSSSSQEDGRFVPGMLIAGRYRIISLLGRGGMGEVYRADDLSLGQSVALKFLPETTADELTLDRFRNEVRIARRISHPNVCRVYDIGQSDNQVFLSMEYIDGEDLSSLLRRIGRLPADKALEIARKICAGLGAAHDKGVLHRDLKPSNIMLDGRGEILITDFGLAGVAHEIEDVRSGTPAYMAPEQLAGKEVTARSDIYALGLVLYELFTGKPAFMGYTRDEIMHVRRTSTPHRPSTLVRDMDPTVERAIMRCLADDPEERPATALMVTAALPGGDPLAAALAAGETPSPQLVAAAGETAGMPVRPALIAAAAALIGLIACFVIGARISVAARMDLPYSPEVLSQKARDIVRQLGYPAAPVDTASGMEYKSDYLEYLDHAGGEHPDWDVVFRSRPAVLNYWQRGSPDYLIGSEIKSFPLMTPGLVDLDDPPPTLSGMTEVTLDPEGRLVRFAAIPPQKLNEASSASPQPYDWKELFTLAGLDMTQFHAVAPTWNSLAASDQRAAWSGVWPGTSHSLRVEAGAFQGKPVYFQLIGDWTEPDRMVSGEQGSKVPQVLMVFFLLLLLGGAVWLARRNHLQQKGDPVGALRTGGLIFGLQMLVWVLNAHFMPSLGTFYLFILATATSLFVAAVFYVVYLAIEPYVRRHWPHGIISWSRLLTGRIRDPLVGRDALFGVLLGVTWTLIFEFMFLALKHIGATPDLSSPAFFLGARRVLGACASQLTTSIEAALVFFFLMFVFRVILRKPWLAALAFVALWTATKSYDNHHFIYIVPAYLAVYGIAAFVVLRFGFIALAVGLFTVDLLANLPLTTDVSSWYLGNSVFVVLLIAAVAVWGCYCALAGQKLIKEHLFE